VNWPHLITETQPHPYGDGLAIERYQSCPRCGASFDCPMCLAAQAEDEYQESQDMRDYWEPLEDGDVWAWFYEEVA